MPFLRSVSVCVCVCVCVWCAGQWVYGRVCTTCEHLVSDVCSLLYVSAPLHVLCSEGDYVHIYIRVPIPLPT